MVHSNLTISNSLTFSGIQKKFGNRKVLTDAGYQLQSGQSLLLEGENGAGKTTLFKILAGVTRADAYKEISLNRNIEYKSTQFRRKLFYLGHSPSFYMDISAEDNLRFFASIYGVSIVESAIRDLLSRARLERRRSDPVRSFSRGMVQRLSICSAFMIDAAVYLLDEPYTALDRESERFVNALILEARERGSCFMITTHDPEKVSDVISHRALLHQGRILEK